jgi:hypothetical protein
MSYFVIEIKVTLGSDTVFEDETRIPLPELFPIAFPPSLDIPFPQLPELPDLPTFDLPSFALDLPSIDLPSLNLSLPSIPFPPSLEIPFPKLPELPDLNFLLDFDFPTFGFFPIGLPNVAISTRIE